MRYAIGLVFILVFALLFLFVLPNGFNGITSSAIYQDGGVRFKYYSPGKEMHIVPECYTGKLEVDYDLDCEFCQSKDIREYFWFKNAKDKDFQMLQGDRKEIKAGKEYSAQMDVEICKGNEYQWYMCIDDATLRCIRKNNPLEFKVN